MLSRNAYGLYWIGRYMERAGFVSRLIIDQLRAIQDRPAEDIHVGWKRLYSTLGTRPVSVDLDPDVGDENYMLVDVFTLTDDLVFEAYNPDAVLSCFATARENARQIRNNITYEMWTCLNASYLEMRDVRLQDIWETQPEDFLTKAALAVRTFNGVAESTMYRDHGWHFLRIGVYQERAINITSLLRSHINLFPTSEAHREWNWSSLLGICEVRSAFRNLHSFKFNPNHVVEFLFADEQLAISAHSALTIIQQVLTDLTADCPDQQNKPGIQVRSALALFEDQWPNRNRQDDAETLAMINSVNHACQLLNHELEQNYFFYEIEDTPPT
ncbi:MAG: alpha-E domain-containing protein [Gammaproteobacteria bacterium]|nr:alpha-E domain-containing protein [Gammaproteobacteria bacterium]